MVLNAPTAGVLNDDLYLRRLSEKPPNIWVVVEHLDAADVPRSKTFSD